MAEQEKEDVVHSIRETDMRSPLRSVVSATGMALHYLGAIVTIFAIAIAAGAYDGERIVTIYALCGTVLAALLALLKSNDDYIKAQNEVHAAVNSKMDRLLQLVDTAARAEGKLAGKKEQKELNGEGVELVSENPNLVVKSITTDKIEVKDPKLGK